MSQHQGITYLKPPIRVTDIRSYSQNRQSAVQSSPVQNSEEMTNTKTSQNIYKPGQQLAPSSKPQATEQSYKDKIQQLENRLGEENKYLRETTETALQKLEQANATISRMKREKQDLEKENKKLLNELERRNSSAKELTDVAEKMRRQNASLNNKITDLNTRLNQSKQKPSQINLRDKVYGNIEMRNNYSRRQSEDRNSSPVQRVDSKQKSTNRLYPLPQNSETQQSSRPTIITNSALDQMRSMDRINQSKQLSLAQSKRSNSRSAFIDQQLSPKESARMEILFEEIGIIKKNLANGGKLSQSIANKLFSLVNHLTNALNKRNDQTVDLKSKLKEYQSMMLNRQPYQSNYQSLDNTFTEDFSPLNNTYREKQYKSIDKSRGSFDTYLHAPIRSDLSNLLSPSSFKPNDRSNIHSRNQSVELSRNKYNYVYKRIELSQFLERKITVQLSIDLLKKTTDLVQKQLSSLKELSVNDFCVLYCEGQCPSNMKLRVELKPKKDQDKPLSTRANIIKSLGVVFQQIVKSIKIQSFDSQKLFDKSVSPIFTKIINYLVVDPQTASMENLKQSLQTLNY